MIGKDIENESNCRQIEKIVQAGHEIGNHSYSHFQNIAERKQQEIYFEIKKAHDLIKDNFNINSKGFISPAWSYSMRTSKVLQELGYEYDTSLAPSFIMPIGNFKLWLQSKSREMIPLIRSDLKGALFGERNPFYPGNRVFWNDDKQTEKEGLIMLPLPTTKLRFPIWHTLSFMIDESKWVNIISKNVDNPGFYYLMHPVDLLCPEKDLKNLPSQIKSIERINTPLVEKLKKAELVFEILKERGTVCMHEKAKLLREGTI